MSDFHCPNAEPQWRHLPVCRSYLLVRFQSISLPVQGSPSGLAIFWALGVHADGGGEVMGAWPGPSLDTLLLMEVFEELRTRGLEKVCLVAGIDQSVTGSAMGTSYPSWSAKAEQLGPSSSLTPRLCRAIRYGEAATQYLARSLRRAVGGRRGFPDGAAAASFVAESLMRAERTLSARAESSRVSRRPHELRSSSSPSMGAARI